MDEETHKRLRELNRSQDRSNAEHSANRRNEATALTRRFVAAGWGNHGWWVDKPESVIVSDRNGKSHWWSLRIPQEIEDCLKTLGAAEKAAKERAE